MVCPEGLGELNRKCNDLIGTGTGTVRLAAWSPNRQCKAAHGLVMTSLELEPGQSGLQREAPTVNVRLHLVLSVRFSLSSCRRNCIDGAEQFLTLSAHLKCSHVPSARITEAYSKLRSCDFFSLPSNFIRYLLSSTEMTLMSLKHRRGYFLPVNSFWDKLHLTGLHLDVS
jgi:hypothetical protein